MHSLCCATGDRNVNCDLVPFNQKQCDTTLTIPYQRTVKYPRTHPAAPTKPLASICNHVIASGAKQPPPPIPASWHRLACNPPPKSQPPWGQLRCSSLAPSPAPCSHILHSKSTTCIANHATGEMNQPPNHHPNYISIFIVFLIFNRGHMPIQHPI